MSLQKITIILDRDKDETMWLWKNYLKSQQG